jgi:hypothetical protein
VEQAIEPLSRFALPFVAKISPANLQAGTMPPPGKTLHKDCPK